MIMKIGLVSDSTADIPQHLQEQYGIEVVPSIINANGQSYEDGNGMSRQEFYTRLPGMKPPPTTSSPAVGAFQVRFERLFKQGADFVVAIHSASTLSGIYNGARLAAQEYAGRVKVVDSGQLSLGIGFQVLAAAEGIARGAGLDEVISIAESIRQRVRVIALLDTLEYVRRSGRVSWAKAMLGSFLHVHPLIELRHGIVVRLGQVRTRLQGVARMKEMLTSFGPLERLAVLHTNAEAAARQFLDEFKSRLPVLPFIVNVTTAVGTHIGPNGLGFAAVPAA
jgi:fatty acid kinase fatty acid binding subunit